MGNHYPSKQPQSHSKDERCIFASLEEVAFHGTEIKERKHGRNHKKREECAWFPTLHQHLGVAGGSDSDVRQTEASPYEIGLKDGILSLAEAPLREVPPRTIVLARRVFGN